MEKEEAINIIGQVCAAFKGTLQEHNALQQALQCLNKLKESAPVKEAEIVKKEEKKE